MALIHDTAIVDPAATIDPSAEIGPYCVVGAEVTLAADVKLAAHAVVQGPTEIGPRTSVAPFAVLGLPAQDTSYAGEPTSLIVGADTVVREHVTVHRGTARGRGETRVGASCHLMVGAHVAHDCVVGDGVTMTNNATLGGHVTVGDGAMLGGLCAVHQFVRIGPGAMVGGMTGVEADIIPFGMVTGDRAALNGLNVVGLRRRGVTKSQLQTMRAAYRELFEGAGTFQDRLVVVTASYADVPLIQQILDFVRAPSKRGLCVPQRGGGTA